MASGIAGRQAGYDPYIVATGSRSSMTETAFGTVKAVRCPVPITRQITARLHRRWLVPAVLDLLGTDPGPHLVHCFGGCWADIAVQAAAAARRRGIDVIPVVTAYDTVRGEADAKLNSSVVSRLGWPAVRQRIDWAWTGTVATRVERAALRGCRQILVNYDSVARRITEQHGPGLPIRQVPYASHLAFGDGSLELAPPCPEPIARLGPPETPLLLTVSRHDARKGLDVFIGALARLRDLGVAFRACMVGTGILIEEHRAMVRDLGLADRVAVAGRVPEVWPYLRHSDVFVLPSTGEGSGSISILEALQAGRAIVASEVDGIPEDLTHDVDAVLVPPNDPAALADALAGVVLDPERRERLGARARTLYERGFSAEALVASTSQIYRELGFAPTRLPAERAASTASATASRSDSVSEDPEGR
jgi:glycosyltransferase involved in cell wall biosynthesis